MDVSRSLASIATLALLSTLALISLSWPEANDLASRIQGPSCASPLQAPTEASDPLPDWEPDLDHDSVDSYLESQVWMHTWIHHSGSVREVSSLLAAGLAKEVVAIDTRSSSTSTPTDPRRVMRELEHRRPELARVAQGLWEGDFLPQVLRLHAELQEDLGQLGSASLD